MPESAWPADAAATLIGTARAAIAQRLHQPAPDAPAPAWLGDAGASFVTLTIARHLRGCIGSLTPWRPLGVDVASNARAAAFGDPRFPPLSAREFSRVAIEVSVLDPASPIAFTSRADLTSQLRPGTDGLILSTRTRRGTFLPQVWDEIPDPADFLDHLLAKAGLPATYWGEDIRVERYTVTAFHERGA